ncbi:MAG: TonB-dependent receptor [Crocinitomicaceae bacterium]|nr:TonB-dependent receptor [Crocinitomicaceae bacterium]
MRVLNFFFSTLFSLLIINSFSQETGIIRGQVFDEGGITIPGARITVIGQTAGAKTDLDGQFSINIAPGTHTIELSALAKDTIRIADVYVVSGEVTILENLVLSEKSIMTGTVVIKAERKDNTENAVLNLKKSSTNMIDGISATNFRKIGDTDAAGAMRRVPGVSVVGGKYIYVRGLGDRYNKTVLNGMDVPGLDPDKNSIQMDIFPTSILDNIIVNKTFIAELPADFTGGIVDIGLKSFPEKQQRSLSLSLGYNPYFHFNQEYLDYERGKTDFLGFDDGTRKIPTADLKDSEIPTYVDAISSSADSATFVGVLKGFNPTMAAMQKMSLMDMSLSASFGNQFKKENGVTIGYNVVGSYRNTTEFYKDAEFGRYLLSPDASVTKLDSGQYQIGDFGVNNVLLSGMAGLAFKTKMSKYVINLVHLQNGESSAGVYDFYNYALGSTFQGMQTNLTYTQRSMTNVFIGGKHDFFEKEKGWKFEWRVAPTLSIMNDPDIRFTRYEVRNDSMLIGTEAGFPVRIWRELNEKSVSSKLDWQKDYKVWERPSHIKFGGAYTFKIRNYNIRNFQLNPRNIATTGDPDELLAEDNLWPYNGDFTQGTTYEVLFIPRNPNNFSSNAMNAGVYVATELNPSQRLKLTLGVRSEYYVQRYTGEDQVGTNVLNNDKVLENLGIFPSLNVVYKATENQNLRFSYGRTVARPSFKEMSYAEIFDPITGRTFIGGLFSDTYINGTDTTVYWDGDLRSTDIHNFDMRWEMFHGLGQTVSLSAFYKMFFDPIEIVQYTIQVGSFQPRNVGDGTVLGGELEMRQSFEFMGEKLKNFGMSLNVTYTYSRIKFSPTEKQSRIENARVGQVIGDYRDMAGQAPYLINAGLQYNGSSEKDAGFLKGLEVGFYYNMQGRTLQFVGIANLPDIYSVPFHSLNFNMNKAFGANQQWRLGLRVTNLLNDKQEMVAAAYQGKDEFFQSLSPGVSARVKLSLSF